jgi:hypothetical protein
MERARGAVAVIGPVSYCEISGAREVWYVAVAGADAT